MLRSQPAWLLTIMLWTACAPADDQLPDPEPLTAMSFNVLCSFCDSSYDPWDDRLGYFADIFERHDPDVLGLQEVSFPSEVEELQALLGDFDALYFDDPTEMAWPDALILFRRARFEVVASGFYWLSPTPDEPFSNGFAPDGQLPRLVAWAHLRELQADAELVFITTHFDNNSPSQELSAPLLLERTEPWAAQLPVLVTGDFNSQTYDEAFAILTGGVDGQGFHLLDTQPLADAWSVHTTDDPPPDYDLAGRIDYLFIDAPHGDDGGDGRRWKVHDWTVDLGRYGESHMYPSDHRAMAATVQLL
jgi:endonuclease/exonuclease/phosphatase family metal-dependent hydrolase